MGYITTISVSQEFHDLAKDNHLSWSEAAKIGMSILMSEKGLAEYDNNLNIVRRGTLIRQKLEEVSKELEELKAKQSKE